MFVLALGAGSGSLLASSVKRGRLADNTRGCGVYTGRCGRKMGSEPLSQTTARRATPYATNFLRHAAIDQPVFKHDGT